MSNDVPERMLNELKRMKKKFGKPKKTKWRVGSDSDDLVREWYDLIKVWPVITVSGKSSENYKAKMKNSWNEWFKRMLREKEFIKISIAMDRMRTEIENEKNKTS